MHDSVTQVMHELLYWATLHGERKLTRKAMQRFFVLMTRLEVVEKHRDTLPDIELGPVRRSIEDWQYACFCPECDTKLIEVYTPDGVTPPNAIMGEPYAMCCGKFRRIDREPEVLQVK